MNRTTPTRKKGIVGQDLGSEMLLYDAADEVIHVLNRTAQLIWHLCDGRHTVQEIEQAIRARFCVDEGQRVTQDIRQTLEDLAVKGLLETGD